MAKKKNRPKLLEDQFEKRLKTFQMRIKESEYNRVKMLAGIYADGNMTEWFIYGALNAPRKFLSEVPPEFVRLLEESKKKGRK